MKTQKNTRRRTSRLAIGCLLLTSLTTGCSAEPTPPVNSSASADVLGPSAPPTPTKTASEPSSAPPLVTSPPKPTPTPKPSVRPSERPTGGIGTAAVGGWYATWCGPTATQCQNWGGDALLAAVRSFTFGDRPYMVTVHYRGNEVTVRVVSYCQCTLRRGHPVIDLSPAAMKQLEPNYRIIGVLKNVEIEGLR